MKSKYVFWSFALVLGGAVLLFFTLNDVVWYFYQHPQWFVSALKFVGGAFLTAVGVLMVVFGITLLINKGID